MDDYCAFSQKHKCIIWTDYALTRFELEEANTLCQGNWIEIQRKEEYILLLQQLLEANDIPYPDEYEI